MAEIEIHVTLIKWMQSLSLFLKSAAQTAHVLYTYFVPN